MGIKKLARECLRTLVTSQRHLQIDADAVVVSCFADETAVGLQDCDAWLEYLIEEVKVLVGATHANATGIAFQGAMISGTQLVRVDSTKLKAQILLIIRTDGVFAFLIHDGLLPREEERIWAEALSAVKERLARGLPNHRWWAAIGPRLAGNSVKNLLVPLDLGRVRLSPFSHAVRETPHDGLVWAKAFEWVPVNVSGESEGHKWPSAAETAHQDLHRVCALLALAGDNPWIVREGPDPRAEPPPLTFAPAESTEHIRLVGFGGDAEARSAGIFVDSNWMSEAWQRVESDERISALLAAYNEGLAMEVEHPSFALIAFVSCIERIGSLLFGHGKSEQCKACNRPLYNSSRAIFRRTLELVVDDRDRLRRMVDEEVYAWRSATGHAAVLHQHENTLGYQSPRLVCAPMSKRDMFGVRGIRNAKDAAKGLLIKLLTGDLVLLPADAVGGIQNKQAPVAPDISKALAVTAWAIVGRQR